MKRLIFISASFLMLSAAAFPHMSGMGEEGHAGGKKASHGHMGMMMFMMQDPEIRKIVREHRKKCMRELMEKLTATPSVQKRLINMMLSNPEAVREVLKNNPELKRRLEELLK